VTDDQLLTIKEAAKRINRHPKTVWLWTVEGKIPYLQVSPGGKILLKLADLMEFVSKTRRT